MSEKRHRVIVLGTGFAAFSFLKKLRGGLFDVTVVSPRNHFLFTPLLPSTTVGTLEFRSIIEPIRKAVPGVQYIQAICTAVDHQNRTVTCQGVLNDNSFTLEFDYLIIAIGAINNTFNVPGVNEHAFFLKELVDARLIRQRIIDCFEEAAQPSLQDERRRQLLQFVVVGGGPTGVEFAAELHDFVEEDLRRPYAFLLPFVHIVLLEAGPSILSTFDTVLSHYTAKLFRRQQIEILTQSPVIEVRKDAVVLKDYSVIPYGLLVWSTGIGPTQLAQSVAFPTDRKSRLITDEWFRVKGFERVYAMGDCATVEDKDFPATSQVAQQEGSYLARVLGRAVRGESVKTFRYHHFGMLAYVGSRKALADLAAVKGRGLATWIFWRSAYLTKLVSLKNKVLVLFDWTKTVIFGRDISRF